MYTKREMAAILAALLYWREELAPHGVNIMRPYFKAVGLPRTRPLSVDETIKLSKRLRSNILK